MRKWIIIEDEVEKAELAIKVLKEKKEKYFWIYISGVDISQMLYPYAKPDFEIKSNDHLSDINKIIQEADEIILLMDVQLTDIINSQYEFLNNNDYLLSLSEIAKKSKYYLGIYSNKVDASSIEEKLNQYSIKNIYTKYGFKKNQDSVENGISEIINKWNSLYESLTIMDFITEYDNIVNAKYNKPNFHVENEEYVQGRDLIKRLIRLDDDRFNTICSLNYDNIFSGFLKGLFENKGISLFGIYLIFWATYSQTFNNHELFLKEFSSINGNWSNFSRDKMFISWKNDESKKADYFSQINNMFEMLLKCNHHHDCRNKKAECALNQSVLKDIQIDTNLLTLSLDLCIDGEGFAEKFDEKVDSLFKKEYNTMGNESSEKILMVMKNTWGKNSGISFETIQNNNFKIKFYIV